MHQILLFLFFFASAGAMAQDMAVATVRLNKTVPISGNKLEKTIEALEQQQGRALVEAEKKQVLEQMIDQILVVQAAEAEASLTVSAVEIGEAAMRLLSQQLQAVGAIPPGAVLTDRTQYKQMVEQQGVSIVEFEETVRKQILTEKYVTSREQEAFQNIGTATEAELRSEYQNRISEFVMSDSVWFNQIFFDTMRLSAEDARKKMLEAQEVHRRLLNTSANFSALVASESEDDASRARGGLIGPVMAGDQVADQLYGSEFIGTLFSMDVNQISGVLKSNVGYHIVQITKKKDAQLLEMEEVEVKSYLEQVVYASKYQRIFEEATRKIVEELRGKSTINYFGDYQ